MKAEIIISHVHLETALKVSDDYVQMLIVENPSEFYSMVADMDAQFGGEEGLFVFSADDKRIDCSKVGAMVSDLFHFDLNDKKIINLLYKELEKVACGEKIVGFNELSSNTLAYAHDLAFCLPFSLEFNDPQPIDIFKMLGVKFEKNYDSVEEKIICYINALIELKKCEFFVFVNLKSVLDDEKLLEVYKHCEAEQVGLLLIESGKVRPLLPCEKAVIITEDLCEIVENY